MQYRENTPPPPPRRDESVAPRHQLIFPLAVAPWHGYYKVALDDDHPHHSLPFIAKPYTDSGSLIFGWTTEIRIKSIIILAGFESP